MKKFTYMALVATMLMSLASCNKVSLTGILIGGSGTDDRVEMSIKYQEMLDTLEYNYRLYRFHYANPDGSYSYLVGSDSHVTTDPGRLQEMMQMCLDNNDLFCAHLGDIVDTKAEYYYGVKNLYNEYTTKYREALGFQQMVDPETGGSYWTDEDGNIIGQSDLQSMEFPFYVTVGNHDVTHNGWALFHDLFQSSFFQTYVIIKPSILELFIEGFDWDTYTGPVVLDRHIFLDSANGTLGRLQVEAIENDQFLVDMKAAFPNNKVEVRNTFTYTHTNIFRPNSTEFASTYAREELYFLLNKFEEWDVNTAFLGHVHQWDDRYFGTVHYITMDAMSSNNNPEPGDYLVRVNVGSQKDEVKLDRVRMNYVSKDKK